MGRPRDVCQEAGAAKTIFSHACFGDLEALQEVLRPKPGLAHQPNNYGLSLLTLAALGGEVSVVRLLVEECGCDVNVNGRGLSPLQVGPGWWRCL
jgi:hypothetical protein